MYDSPLIFRTILCILPKPPFLWEKYGPHPLLGMLRKLNTYLTFIKKGGSIMLAGLKCQQK